MKHGNQTMTIPKPQNLPAKPATAPSPRVEPMAMVVGSVEELLKAVSEGKVVQLSAEAKAEVEKFKTAHDTLEAPKRLSAAESEATIELPRLLQGIAGKHKVSFSGRKVVIVFKTTVPEGEPNPLVSFGPEVETVAARTKRSVSGKGFKSHGEVVLIPEKGKEMHYGSFGAMAKALGFKMEGRANATIAITNPATQEEWDKMDSDARKNIPAKYRVEPIEKDGKPIQYVYPVLAS